jgi:hypothetical protein
MTIFYSQILIFSVLLNGTCYIALFISDEYERNRNCGKVLPVT